MELDKLYVRNSNPLLFDDEQEETNCGSFALNVTKWYTPYLREDYVEDESLMKYCEYEREEMAREMLLDGYSREEVMRVITELDFEFIMKTCPWLMPIKKEDITPTDRVIAYRLSLEDVEPEEFDMDTYGDFHFRLFVDGEWYEKNGAGPVHIIDNPEEDDIWEVDGWLVYDGPIKYAKFVEEK